jgi:hypothetical protein
LEEQEEDGQTKYRIKAEQTKTIHTVKLIGQLNGQQNTIIPQTFMLIFGE